jgi:3'-phosphoadenosine 5'-phosphosulfate sulfotransferase (PAPS reductase)/FAD synthetase
MDLRDFDAIVISTSGGKDSQTQLRVICDLAKEQGVLDRCVAVHCDLGRVEWKGTRELAEEQVAHYGIPCIVVSRPQGDLLDHARQRGKWFGHATRYCTSDHKRDQVKKVFTQITRELQAPGARCFGRKVKILNCLGLRAAESKARAKLVPFQRNAKASNKTKREVFDWLPIHDWSDDRVWGDIKLSGVRHHDAYDLGLPRLSCVFCIFAPREALVLAGHHNRELLAEYVQVEREIDHTFRQDLSLAEIQEAVEAGEQAGDVGSWSENF